MNQRKCLKLLLLQLPLTIAFAQLTLIARTPGAGNFLVINILAWFSSMLLWLDVINPLRSIILGRYAFFALPILFWTLVILSRPHTLYDSLLNAVPFATFSALILLIHRCRWHPFLLLGLLPALHYGITTFFPTYQLSRFTAILAAQFLWLAGHSAVPQADLILLPTHRLQIGPGCTGVNALSLCVASVVSLLLLNGSLSPVRSAFLLCSAPVLAISVNAFRVALLALMPVNRIGSGVSESSQFAFWHDGLGSTLFALLAVSLLFALEHCLSHLDIRSS